MIDIVIRALCIIAGCGLLATTTALNVEHVGGIGSEQSWQFVASAVALVVGAIGLGWLSGQRRWGAALMLGALLFVGEAYSSWVNSDRAMAGREAQQVPLREAAQRHAAAELELANAERAKPIAADRARLVAAQKRQDDAEASVRASAAEKSCRENCRMLLQTAVDAATAEIAAARTEIEQQDKANVLKLAQRIADARTALAKAPLPPSENPLADRMGIAHWVYDIAISVFGAICFNLLSAVLVAVGAHSHRGHRTPAPAPVAPIRMMSTDVVEREPARPTRSPLQIEPPAPAAKIAAPVAKRSGVRAVGKVDEWSAHALFPKRKGRIYLDAAYSSYLAWCRNLERRALDAGDFADRFRDIIDELALDVQATEDGPVIIGATIQAA